LGPVYRPSSFF
jgi:hypothetical protein